MSLKKAKVGIIGCGAISPQYFNACKIFDILEVAACADMDMEKAKAKARATEFGAPKVLCVKELLEDPTIEIIINLTVPKSNAEIDMVALNAGKHVFSEKPFSINREEGKNVLDLARKKKRLVGSAPDTFMGGGAQTCRKVIDDGWIGKPIACVAFLACRGVEHWHPNPEFYYKVGGGPMFDMGPYYLTALVNLLGPVKRVTGSTKISFPERTITSKPQYGKKVNVEVPTHIAGVMDFVGGVVGTIIMSFDVWKANLPQIEIYGTEGTLSVPNPNGTGGPVRVFRPGMENWGEVPLIHGYTEGSRGIGVADMAYAIRSGRPYRANGEMAFHVVDVMQALHEAATEGKHINLESTCQQPSPLPLGLATGTLDL